MKNYKHFSAYLKCNLLTFITAKSISNKSCCEKWITDCMHMAPFLSSSFWSNKTNGTLCDQFWISIKYFALYLFFNYFCLSPFISTDNQEYTEIQRKLDHILSTVYYHLPSVFIEQLVASWHLWNVFFLTRMYFWILEEKYLNNSSGDCNINLKTCTWSLKCWKWNNY